MIDLQSLILELIQEDLWLSGFVFLLFLRSCPRKAFFAAKLVGGLLVVIAFSAAQEVLERQLPRSVLVSLMSRWDLILSLIIIALYMMVMFQCNWNMMLFGSLAGLCAQEVMFGIWTIIKVLAPSLDTFWGEILICCVIGSAAAVALYYFLAVKITPRSLQMLQKRSLVPLLLLYLLSLILINYSTNVVIFLNVFFDPIRNALASVQDGAGRLGIENVRMSSIYSSLAGNAMVLFALRNMLRYSESDLERQLLEQIREQDRKQFTHFRNNVDYINTKSHDLKHYLDLLQRNEKIPQEELQRVSESILRLDSETDSGNETLDMILTDRRLVCAREGIELIFQTDGTRLEQLDTIDTFGIFCNVLDNAIGYVKELPPEDRSIRLGIRTIHNMVFIHQENPFVGELLMKDGLPVTTQSDETCHGFGLKSVQNTVKKRKGELIIRAENGRFELDICFPGE